MSNGYKKHEILLEDRGFKKQVTIWAKDKAHAIQIADRYHTQPMQVTVNPRPTWVAEYPDDPEAEIYEFDTPIHDRCADCNTPVFDGDSGRGWPWEHASGDEGCYTSICFPCAMLREQSGNYCSRYDHYYKCENKSCACNQEEE